MGKSKGRGNLVKKNEGIKERDKEERNNSHARKVQKENEIGVYSCVDALFGLEGSEEKNNNENDNVPKPMGERIEKVVSNKETQRENTKTKKTPKK